MILPAPPNRYDQRDETITRQALTLESIQLRALLSKLSVGAALPPNATDLATTITLVNAIKAALINAGFSS